MRLKNKNQNRPAGDKLGCPEIRKFKIGEIHPAEYNPRTIKDENLEALAHSIQHYGCVEPVIVNIYKRKNTIGTARNYLHQS